MSSTYGVRWHTTVPLAVADSQWTRNVVGFRGDKWHRSWTRNGTKVVPSPGETCMTVSPCR